MTGRPRTAPGPARTRAPRRVASGPFAASPLDWSEAQLQRAILGLCGQLDEGLQRQYPGVPGMRLLVHHETDSRKTAAGWLDLTIAGPGGLVIPELKREKGRLRPEQAVWLEVLEAAGVAAYVWRPSDWVAGAIQNELHRIARPIRRPAAPPAPAGPRRRGCGCPVGEPHTCETWRG